MLGLHASGRAAAHANLCCTREPVAVFYITRVGPAAHAANASGIARTRYLSSAVTAADSSAAEVVAADSAYIAVSIVTGHVALVVAVDDLAMEIVAADPACIVHTAHFTAIEALGYHAIVAVSAYASNL